MTSIAYSLMKKSLPANGLDLLMVIASNEGIGRKELQNKVGYSIRVFGATITKLEDLEYIEVENRRLYRQQKFALKEKGKELLYKHNPIGLCGPCQEFNRLKEAKRYISGTFVCKYHYDLVIDD